MNPVRQFTLHIIGRFFPLIFPTNKLVMPAFGNAVNIRLIAPGLRLNLAEQLNNEKHLKLTIKLICFQSIDII